MATAAPFDAWAADYDAKFTERLPARWLRESVRGFVSPWLAPGTKVLEIGCGTGADALWMAQRGCEVLATDFSEAMLERTRERIFHAKCPVHVTVQRLDATDPSALEALGAHRFDVVFSNFGALNCHDDIGAFFAAIDPSLRPGGVVAVALMGRFCLAETLRFGLRLDFRAAARRWRGSSSFAHNRRKYAVWYYAPGEVRRLAGSRYSTEGTYGIGTLLPTSEGYRLCEKWPRLFRPLAMLDRRLARFHYLTSDHYLLVLRDRERVT
jgi:SAM-dependent methyltransferase